MTATARGGRTTYGHLVGILMSDSIIPRIPGDPGHAETFPFPVVYEVLEDFPFEDLISVKKDNIAKLIDPALRLQHRGVSLVVTDCGLFGPYHDVFKAHLNVPFIGTALDLVPLLQHFYPADRPIAIITGDTRILSSLHFEASGIDPETIVIAGMENSSEFKRVVIERHLELDIDQMRKGVSESAATLAEKNIGAVVLECTNLISYRGDIQKILGVPVFDLVSLIELYVSGLSALNFQSRFILPH